MNYDESVQYIHSLPKLARSGRHDRIEALLGALGHPEKTGRYVHVTGTNGKGSVASAVAHILEASGLHVGLFTSPFIMRFNERFMIDHVPLADDALTQATIRVKAALEACQRQQADFMVTEFEFITALAFWVFTQQRLDAAVIEVGIGGDTDSTNVITPLVSVITSVGLDHQALLGNTLTSVATHKAGIIKPGVPVVTGTLPTEAMAVVQAKTHATHSHWLSFGREFTVDHARLAGWGQQFTYQDDDGKFPDVLIPLVGQYQLGNMAVAIQAAKQWAQAAAWPLAPAEWRRGLAASRWPARLEKISDEPLIVLDGAHNPQGIRALIAALRQLFGHQSLTLIVGVLADKAVDEIVTLLRATPYRLWLVPVPDNPRATPLSGYPQESGVRTFASWQEALAAQLADFADEPVVFAGSLYLVAAVRQTLLEE